MEDFLALMVVLTACIISLIEVFDKVETNREILKNNYEERKEEKDEV